MFTRGYYIAELIERVCVTESLAVFKFKPASKLSFKAGQYATIGVEIRGELYERPYSIVSSPKEDILEIFIELVKEGTVTPRLWEMKIGSKVWIRPRVVGHLSLKPSCERHLILATVTGIAPFISIARTERLEGKNLCDERNKILIIHGASHSRDFGPYLEELGSMSNTGWLKYVPTVSRPWGDAEWTGEIGRIEDVVRKHADANRFLASNSFAYACGHPNMIKNVREILIRAGFSSDQIQEEDYFPGATAIASTPDKLKPRMTRV